MIISSHLIQIFLNTQGISNTHTAFGFSFPLAKVTKTKQCYVNEGANAACFVMGVIWELSSLVANWV